MARACRHRAPPRKAFNGMARPGHSGRKMRGLEGVVAGRAARNALGGPRATRSTCEGKDPAQQRTALVPLLDNTGPVVTFLPESEVRRAATGTPFAVNRGGQLLTLTVGPRQADGVPPARPA